MSLRVMLIYATRISHAIGGVEPLGVMSLASVLKEAGHEVIIISQYNKKYLINKFIKFRPHIVGFSTVHLFEIEFILLCSEMKKIQPFFSIFGGPSPTVSPEIIEKYQYIDAVCIGEGERSLIEFCRRFKNGEDIYSCPGFWFKVEERIFKNDLMPLIDDLDSLPFPDREELYKNKLYNFAKIRTFIGQRGCPFNCTFCQMAYIGQKYGNHYKRVRTRSPASFIAEIRETKYNYGISYIIFQDDIFGIDVDWLREFSGYYKKEIGVNFLCMQRFGVLTEEHISLLSEVGCNSIILGVESADEGVRKKLLHRDISNDKIIKTIKTIKKYNISVIINYIFCLPGCNLTVDLNAIEFNEEVNPDIINVSFFYPLPKVELTTKAINEGYFDGNYLGNINLWNHKSLIKVPNKRERENLQKITRFVHIFPALKPLIPLLMKLPLAKFYRILDEIYTGYVFRKKVLANSYGNLNKLKTLGYIFYSIFKHK